MTKKRHRAKSINEKDTVRPLFEEVVQQEFAALVGYSLIGAFRASLLLGHHAVRNTWMYLMPGEDTPEPHRQAMEFVIDILRGTKMDVMVERWRPLLPENMRLLRSRQPNK